MRKLCVCRTPAAACLWLALSVAGCDTIKSRDFIRAGNAAYEAGHYAEAIEHYNRSLTLEPEGVTVLWNRACAAEAEVLRLSGIGELDEAKLAARKRYADLALDDFHKWADRLEGRTEADLAQVERHRLAILDADERCDELLQHWLDKHQAEPHEPRWYTVVARQYDKCEQPEQAREWLEKATVDFPKSAMAWLQLATWDAKALWPDDPNALVNEGLSQNERITVVEQVVPSLDRALEVDPKFQGALGLRAMMFDQRRYARILVDDPQAPEERLEHLRAHDDAMAAWTDRDRLCQLNGKSRCGPADDDESGECCPDPPYTEAQRRDDAQMRADVLAEIEAAKQAVIEGEPTETTAEDG